MEIISVYSLIPLIGSVFVAVLGFFVWLKNPKQWMHILFLLYCITIAIWLFGTFRLFNSITEERQIFWDRFIYIGVVFIPIFLYHFGLLYCGIKKQQIVLVIGYVLAFLFLPFSQTDYFVKDIYRYDWGVHTQAQLLHHFFLVFFFFYFILFFINLGFHYYHSIGSRRKQVGYVLLGYAILDLIGPLAFLPAYGIPIYPVIFLSALPFVLLLTYAIIKHNALDLKTITVEVVVTMINLAALVELIFSQSAAEVVLRLCVLSVVLSFSIVLVRSVKKEIHRREEVAELANSLEKANLRLQELDRQKTEFLSIASHQLRTPLSIMKGYIELIQDGAFGKINTKVNNTLAEMDDSNERLVKLVDEFLDITRIEQGRTKFDFCYHDLNKLVAGVVKELEERAGEKKLKIRWQKVVGLDKVYMDDEKVRHVIFNFIDNAIKYSEKGEIRVVTGKEDGGIFVRVQDNGLGFDKQDQANFFQKFYRGKNVKNTNINGTGLGLYVCDKFIENHQGRVWARSPGPGKGSEFGFWIPREGACASKEKKTT